MSAAPTSPPPTKTLDELFKTYETQIAELKEVVRAIPESDKAYEKEDLELILLRFVTGYRGNMEEAKKAIEKATHWRIEYKTWNAEKFHGHHRQAELNKLFQALSFHKVDKNGRPQFWSFLGLLKTKEYLSRVTIEEHKDILSYNLTMEHRILNQISRKNNRIEKLLVIFDLTGLSMEILKYKEFFSVDTSWTQMVLVEQMAKCLVVGCPAIFNVPWKLVKGWLDPRVQEKIEIVGHADTETVLKKYIDEENLPDFRGGKCRCGPGNYLCCPDMNFDDIMTHVSVSSGTVYTKEFSANAGAKIAWKAHPSPLFSITFNGTEVVTESEGVREFSGKSVATVKFDNTKAWMSGSMAYTVQISYPGLITVEEKVE